MALKLVRACASTSVAARGASGLPKFPAG